MDRIRIHLDTAQYVMGVPTFMAFAEDAPEQKLLPAMDPDEALRLERCRHLTEVNETIRRAWEEALQLKREGKLGW